MADLNKDIEEQILDIVKKYQKEENQLLNYLITDENTITFFSPISNGSAITASDLQKVAEILNGTFDGMEIINQEYRFKFTFNL